MTNSIIRRGFLSLAQNSSIEWVPTIDFPAECQRFHPRLPLHWSLPTLGLVCQEAVDFGDGSIEDHHGEAMVGSIQDQVLAHDGQTDEAEITTGFSLRG